MPGVAFFQPATPERHKHLCGKLKTHLYQGLSDCLLISSPGYFILLYLRLIVRLYNQETELFNRHGGSIIEFRSVFVSIDWSRILCTGKLLNMSNLARTVFRELLNMSNLARTVFREIPTIWRCTNFADSADGSKQVTRHKVLQSRTLRQLSCTHRRNAMGHRVCAQRTWPRHDESD